MELEIREAIDEANRLSEANKNLTRELEKAISVVDSQQREIHHLQAANHSNILYIIEIGKENKLLREGKPDMKPEKIEEKDCYQCKHLEECAPNPTLPRRVECGEDKNNFERFVEESDR